MAGLLVAGAISDELGRFSRSARVDVATHAIRAPGPLLH